jgi:hypothetical protein
VIVQTVNGREYAQACGSFFDMCDQDMLRHLGTPELAAAVKGASTRPLGDAWAWSRKGSEVDISPLVSCTLALRGKHRRRRIVGRWFRVVGTKRRVALHMKPGCGPTIEGLLVKYHRRAGEYELIDAQILRGRRPDAQLAGPVFVLRENVYCRQAI